METFNQTTRKNGMTYTQGIQSKFLTICDNILEQINNDPICPPMALNESFGGEHTQETFNELYEQMMRENARSTFRNDKLGNRIEVPYGATFKIGKNGKGVSIPVGWTWKEDKVGQIHAIAPNCRLKVGLNGKGVKICN